MKPAAFLIAAAATLLLPAAHAQDAFATLKDSECPANGVLEPSYVIYKLMEGASIPKTKEYDDAFSSRALGTLAAAKEKAGEKGPIVDLYKMSIQLFAPDQLDGTPSADDPVVVRIVPKPGPNDTTAWGKRFLNRDDSWARFDCFVKPQTSSGDGPVSGKEPSGPKLPPFRIAKSHEDLKKPLKDRKFASLGLESEDGDTSILANIAIGWASQPLFNKGTFYEVSWSPFVEYNRKTADDPTKEINDVTLGAGLVYAVGPRTYPVSFDTSLAWQTDDEGEASVWKIENLSTLPNFGFCTYPNDGGWYSGCELSIGADHVEVSDPGTNPAWASLNEYTRAGADVSLFVGRDFGEASLTLEASYKSRFDLTDNDATAELKAVNLTLEPGDDSRFSFGIAYENGRDLSTLADTDTFSITLGYRQ